MAGSIFTTPSGSPGKKPSNIKLYPDFPEIGGMKSTSTSKNTLSIEKRAGAGKVTK